MGLQYTMDSLRFQHLPVNCNRDEKVGLNPLSQEIREASAGLVDDPADTLRSRHWDVRPDHYQILPQELAMSLGLAGGTVG
jgi:hypothetical protein